MVCSRDVISVIYSDTGFLWEKPQDFLNVMGFFEGVSLCTFQKRCIERSVWTKTQHQPHAIEMTITLMSNTSLNS